MGKKNTGSEVDKCISKSTAHKDAAQNVLLCSNSQVITTYLLLVSLVSVAFIKRRAALILGYM